MNTEEWTKIESMFHALKDLSEPDRQSRLSEFSINDPKLAVDLESLLRSADIDAGILDRHAFSAGLEFFTARPPDEERLPPNIGTYQFLKLIGRGGMGSVYLARDSRLDRLVAVKILDASVAKDPANVARFRFEARAASKFSHPNIAHIYDFGESDGRYFLAMEYVEGRSMRTLIGDKYFDRERAVCISIQLAYALAAAHRSGITHRDIKPENVVITADETVKVLDFGLAKWIAPVNNQPQLDANQTLPGMVLGTTPYMSPEQIRGESVDGRADIWALGVILYEMLMGERPFGGDSVAETMSSVLKDEPTGYALMEQNHGTALVQVVRKCLAKNLSKRFESANDLGFLLENLSDRHETHVTKRFYRMPRSSGWRAMLYATAVVGLIVVGLVFAFFRSPTLIGGASFTGVHPLFRQVTFQRGTVWAARFAPGGQTMIYTATWNGGPLELYGLRQTSPESRSFDLPNRKLLSISSKGEMAILRPAAYLYQFIHRGTLARVPIEGGGPRELAENIQEADWTPEGREMAVVRWVEGRNRLEFPIGNSLVETTGYISNPRFSPNGETIAFLDHERQWDNRGTVSVVDIHGNKKALTEEFSGLEGLAWHPMTGEIWFTGSQNGEAYALYAVNTDGLTRLVERAPADLMLFDISADGRVLMARAEQATDIYGSLPGVPDQNLSWLKLVGIADIAETGKSFLFTHFGEGSGKNYSVYLRETDGSPAVRIGEGRALELSRDGKFIIAKISSPEELVIHPVGAGEIKHIPKGPIEHYTRATWFSDGLRILFAGNEPGKGRRCYIQAVDSEVITPVTPEGLTGSILSPDDKWLVANDVNGRKLLFNLENGETRPIKNLDNADEVIRWDDRGKTIYVYRPLEYPIRIFRLDPETGRREPIKEITPLDPAGIIGNPYVFMTADGKKFVYGLRRYLYDLYLTEGLK